MLRGSQAVCPLQHVSNNCSLTRLTQPGLATEKWAPSTFVPVWSTRTVKTVPASVTSPGSTDLHKCQSYPGDCRTIIFGCAPGLDSAIDNGDDESWLHSFSEQFSIPATKPCADALTANDKRFIWFLVLGVLAHDWLSLWLSMANPWWNKATCLVVRKGRRGLGFQHFVWVHKPTDLNVSDSLQSLTFSSTFP